MSGDEFVNIQQALLWVFGPFVFWWFSAFVALGMFAGTNHVWLGFLRWFTRRQ